MARSLYSAGYIDFVMLWSLRREIQYREIASSPQNVWSCFLVDPEFPQVDQPLFEGIGNAFRTDLLALHAVETFLLEQGENIEDWTVTRVPLQIRVPGEDVG